jgi:hypothetical protein
LLEKYRNRRTGSRPSIAAIDSTNGRPDRQSTGPGHDGAAANPGRTDRRAKPASNSNIDPSIGMIINLLGTSRLAMMVALGAGLSLAGCASGAKTVATTPTTEASAADTTPRTAAADALLAQLRQSYSTTPMLTLTGDMKISGAGITVWYDALVRGRDSLRINLVGPFGVPVGALSATPAEFVFFNAQEGVAIEGTPDRETFGKLMMLDMEYDELASTLRGELPRFPKPGSFTAEEHDGVMQYTVREGSRVERFAIDMADLEVLNYSRVITSGAEPYEEIAINYKDFYKLEGRQFPKKVYVAIANSEQKVTVTVDKMRSTIASDRSCSLALPPGIERRRL